MAEVVTKRDTEPEAAFSQRLDSLCAPSSLPAPNAITSVNIATNINPDPASQQTTAISIEGLLPRMQTENVAASAHRQQPAPAVKISHDTAELLAFKRLRDARVTEAGVNLNTSPAQATKTVITKQAARTNRLRPGAKANQGFVGDTILDKFVNAFLHIVRSTLRFLSLRFFTSKQQTLPVKIIIPKKPIPNSMLHGMQLHGARLSGRADKKRRNGEFATEPEKE